MAHHIDVGIVINDAEKCVPFYRDVLGLKFLFDFDLPTGSHMWQFAVGECVVKLVKHDPTPSAANPPGGSGGGTGLRYWTMGVDDIDVAIAPAKEAGSPIPMDVTQLMPGIRIAMIEDPEGNVVEFLEQKRG